MNNNEAFIATIGNVAKIEGADNIQQADVILNGVPVTHVVIGKDMNDGDSVVYFDSNLCISDAVLKIDQSLGRYLGKSGRVKTVKLRGVYSDGLVIPTAFFLNFTKSNIPESFTHLDGVEICHKYSPPMKVQTVITKKGKKGKINSRMIPGLFNFHVDTAQLARNIHKINPTDIVSITRKVHGTSAIVANCKVKRKLSVIEKILKQIGVNIDTTVYDYVYASRSVVKNGTNDGFYKEDLWSVIGKEHFYNKLHKGETVYYEIVGYTPSGSWIQKNYDYGCQPGEHKIAVYRITQTNDDGVVTEYGWQAVKERCLAIGVPHVQEYAFGRISITDVSDVEMWRNTLLDYLRTTYLEKDCYDNLCKKVPDEGIVLRVESLGINVFKLKSLKFLKQETEAVEAGNTDLEAEEANE